MFRNSQTNKKWQKRPQLYKGKFYYFRKLGQFLLLFAIGSGLLGVVMYLRHSETMYIKRVELVGETAHIEPDELLKLSGITPQDKLFTVDLTQVSENLQLFPWIQTARVRREFPGTIQIHVTERVPYLYVAFENEIYIADKSGLVFKKKEARENYDLPVITGFSKAVVTHYPEIAKKDMRTVIDFYNAVAQGKFYRGFGIAQIHFDAVTGLTVFTGGHELEIFYGRHDTGAKQQKLDQIADQSQKWAGAFARLDLNSENRIIARKKHYEQKK